MKILWHSSGSLHPTTRGGQIRTLEMLRRLRTRHEIHYLALHDGSPEALARSSEYCFKAWPVPFVLAPRASARFWIQTAGALFSHLPVMVARKRSAAARQLIEQVLSVEHFDVVVCDFLTPVVNLPSTQPFVLFEHNVETVIWRRYAESASDPVRRAFFRSQAKRLLAFERAACRRATHVITVSEADAELLRELSGISHVSSIPTGVDVEYFSRSGPPVDSTSTKLVFAGSMDWMPNIDGMVWFVREVLPLIRRRFPQCTLTIAGRRPAAAIRALAAEPLVQVTGTVEDIRPYLWNADVSIVPLRIGSGTRLKVYESMAAEIAVVSTTIGAEGLAVTSLEDIRLADTPEAFAGACVELLAHPELRARQAEAGLRLVREKFSWEKVAACFEEILGGHVSVTGGSAPPRHRE
ncbi:MAG: glycosyltransferase [Acidobacteria bacterium]|nr:glycosyltransferase [Acidobacteriota bacterium]